MERKGMDGVENGSDENDKSEEEWDRVRMQNNIEKT